jgi:hypothetical protein
VHSNIKPTKCDGKFKAITRISQGTLPSSPSHPNPMFLALFFVGSECHTCRRILDVVPCSDVRQMIFLDSCYINNKTLSYL